MADDGVAAKDPQAKLPYGWSWAEWLPEGDTIVESTWTGEGVQVLSQTHDDTTASVWLTGGVVGTRAKAVNHIVTAFGLEDDRTLTLHIMDR
jgi:hypothetical protein